MCLKGSFLGLLSKSRSYKYKLWSCWEIKYVTFTRLLSSWARTTFSSRTQHSTRLTSNGPRMFCNCFFANKTTRRDRKHKTLRDEGASGVSSVRIRDEKVLYGGKGLRMRGGGFVSAIKRVFGMKRFGEDTLAGRDEVTGRRRHFVLQIYTNTSCKISF